MNAELRQLRPEVLDRDGEACTRCGATDHLHVHHIMPTSEGGEDTLANLITLCVTCHAKAHERDSVTARLVMSHGKRRARKGVEYRVYRQKFYKGKPCTDPDIHVCTACGNDTRMEGYPLTRSKQLGVGPGKANRRIVPPVVCPDCPPVFAYCQNCGKRINSGANASEATVFPFCSTLCRGRYWHLRSGFQVSGPAKKPNVSYISPTMYECKTCDEPFIGGVNTRVYYCGGTCRWLAGDSQPESISQRLEHFSQAARIFAKQAAEFESWAMSLLSPQHLPKSSRKAATNECSRCGKQRDDRYRTCSSCRAKQRARAKRHREAKGK